VDDEVEFVLTYVSVPIHPPHKADPSNPDLNIQVSVVKNVCAIWIAPHLKELGKYNLRELCNELEAKEEAAPTKEAVGGKAEGKPETGGERPSKEEEEREQDSPPQHGTQQWLSRTKARMRWLRK
jgi:ribosomal protein L12E/L44/L45/RPP1/RPP2